MAFAHLHVHTEYSLLDGSNKIKEYVKRVKELGMTAAAITDHGAMYGVIDFYRAARAEGINPILGCEVYVAPNSRFDREITGGDDRYYHLVLLAENNTGYANLMQNRQPAALRRATITSRVSIWRFWRNITRALSRCLPAWQVRCRAISRKDCRRKQEGAHESISRYFREGQLFSGAAGSWDSGAADRKPWRFCSMSRELDIPLVCTNDVHYTYAEDAEPHDILLCIQTGKKLSDENRMRYEGGQYYVKSEEEMKGLFPYA